MEDGAIQPIRWFRSPEEMETTKIEFERRGGVIHSRTQIPPLFSPVATSYSAGSVDQEDVWSPADPGRSMSPFLPPDPSYDNPTFEHVIDFRPRSPRLEPANPAPRLNSPPPSTIPPTSQDNTQTVVADAALKGMAIVWYFFAVVNADLQLSVGRTVTFGLTHSIVKQVANGRASRRAVVKERATKIAIIDFNNLSRQDFVMECFTAHSINDEFRPGEHHGPPFNVYWTGLA